MTPFELHYNALLDFCRKQIFHNHLVCKAEDLLNDAFIKFIESNESFDLAKFKSLIVRAGYNEKDFQQDSNDITKYKKKELEIKGDQCCSKCKEVKPVAAFRLKDRHGVKHITSMCKKCINKAINKWRSENKQKVSASCNKYINKNRSKWNEYLRNRYKKKGKRVARPIQELWRKANKKRYEKVKAAKDLKKSEKQKPYEFYIDRDLKNYSYDTNKSKTYNHIRIAVGSNSMALV